MTRIKPYLPPVQQADLASVLDKNVAQIWGVAAGAKGFGSQRWERLQVGDIGLFAREGRYFAKCRLTGKVRSAALARHLWPRPEGGQTWEYIYFIDEVVAVDIPYERFNEAIESAAERVPMGFVVLNALESMAAISVFGLDAPRTSWPGRPHAA